MNQRVICVLVATSLIAAVGLPLRAEGEEKSMSQMEHHTMMEGVADGRISLNLPPMMREHQLSNMRSHLVAVQSIVGLIGAGSFDEASAVAHSELGLTDEMRQMCNMFDNEDFRRLGIQFHESADSLGEVLKSHDTGQSLAALQSTMSYCVQCHAAFRQ